MHTDFFTMISISLFYCCEKMFIHSTRWMIGKNLAKLYYLTKKIFTVTEADYAHAKRVSKDLKIKNLGDYHD